MRFESKLVYGVALALLIFSGVFFVGVSSIRADAQSVVVPAQQQIVLRFNQYQYIEIDSFSSNTWVAYTVTSNNPISVAVMTAAQLNAFSSSLTDEISNSVTYQNGTSVQGDVQLAPGQYFLVFYAYASRATINLGYYVYPNTPFSYGAVSSPFASGIATYGITNNSGVAVPYQVQTNEIVGVANITSFLANNPDAASYGDNVAGATLQLNTNLVVNETNGLQDVYWVQNTPDFVTSNNVVSLTDNLWNNTDLTGVLSNQSVTSSNAANGGYVYSQVSQGVTSYAYLFNENNVTYKFPFSFALVESDTVLKGQGVLVQMGFRMLQNGSLTTSPTDWYDNITIHAPSVQSAYFDVNGNATLPIGLYYDSEFVFAGEGNLESTSLTNMSASLGLFYQNETTGVVSSFPSYYSFGGDTGESVTNLAVSLSNGVANVQVGNPNYVYLGSASITLGSNFRLPSSGSSSTTTTGVTTSVPTTAVTTSHSTSGVTTATSTSASKVSGSHGTAILLLVAGIIVVILVVIGVVFMATRRKKPTEQTMQTYPQTIPMQAPSPCPNCGTMLPPGAAFCSNCGQPQAMR
ncbi:MAG: thermopsin family protease [Nitrososphaerales archaeon]